MTAPEHRYTDEMVRTSSALRRSATEYALNYAGDWDFMVAARALADLSPAEGLPVPVARSVLNAMRADPKAQHLLPRVISLSEARERHERKRGYGEIFLADSKPEEVVEEPRRRYPVTLRTNFKMPFLLSTHKSARVAHLVRPTSFDRYGRSQYSRITWSPDGDYSVYLHAWCGSHWYQYAYQRAEGKVLGAKLSDTTEGRALCKTCRANRDIFNERTKP